MGVCNSYFSVCSLFFYCGYGKIMVNPHYYHKNVHINSKGEKDESWKKKKWRGFMGRKGNKWEEI